MRRRMLALFMALTLLTELLLGGGVYLFVRKLLIDRASDRMEDLACLLLGSLEAGREQQQADGWAEVLNAQHDGYRITVVNANGGVCADTGAAAAGMENHAGREEIADALNTGRGVALRYSPTMGTHYLYVAVSDGARVLRVSQDFGQIRQLQRSLVISLVLTAAVAFAVAAGLSAALSRRVLRPVEALRQGAGRIARGELGLRIPEQPDELGELTRDFNAMAEALAQSMEQERSQRVQLQAVLHAIPVGVLAVDAQGTLTQCNPGAAALMGLREDCVGARWASVLRDARLREVTEDTLRDHALHEAEWSAGERVLAASGAPIRGQGGACEGAVVVLRDMTQLRHLEQLRTEFVSNATHELKTPLTAIRGCIETLRDPEVDTSDPAIRSEMLDIMDVQGERLQALISDMLELSQIEGLPSLPEPGGDMARAVREAQEAVGVQAHQAGIELNVDAPETLPCRAPDERMRRIAQNLMENAVRYNRPGGKVWVTVRAEGAQAVLTVRDTGVGIPEKDIPRVCERFYRVDKDRSRNSGGTGLGLAIVKHMVRRYDGELEIRSKLGEGSEFTVRIPADR
ncbi:MAG: ATP-binding protein [Candidatus Spyradocola sp.]